MPEITESEKLLRQIRHAWEGKSIVKWTAPPQSPNPRNYAKHGWKEHLHCTSGMILSVYRIGKALIVTFEGDTHWHISLRSTGWWMPLNDEAARKALIDPIHGNFLHTVSEKTVRVKMHLNDGQIWAYHDARCFGHWASYDNKADLDAYFDTYGPDWLNNPRGAREVIEQLTKTRRTIQDVLTDQSITAGLGFYLSNEIAFRAGVHPQKAWNRLTFDEREFIALTAHVFLQECLRASNHEHWKVFDRKGQPCKTCGNPIQYAKSLGKGQSARGSYFCEHCQGKP